MVAVGSVRSCGTTTLALGLAATWPKSRPVLLVELDPAGGTLAAAAGWPAEPSLVSLAAAARHGGDPELVFEHCQALAGGASVLAAPAAAEQARAALGTLGALLGRLNGLDAAVVCDCGRLDTGSPALSVWGLADRRLVAVRPRLSDLRATATWLEAHPPSDVMVSLVTVGGGPYPDSEITDALGVEVAVHLPWDPGAAEALATSAASARELRLAPLVRACRSLAEHLAAGAPSEQGVEDGPMAARAGTRLARRVLAPWRTPTTTASSNGHTPEEVSR